MHTSMASLLLASAAFVAISQLPWVAQYSNWIIAISALAVTVLNSAVLAFGMVSKAKEHADFKRKWTEFHGHVLNADIESDFAISSLDKLYIDINSSEPAPNKNWLDQAYDATCIAMGVQPAQA